MSDKAASSDQIISLPKGGGAIHGIGEKFSPDLYTGTGNFSLPISLPAGRNGFQPHLNLTYSSGNGNGVFGLGWSLSIPGVSRKTSKRIPQYGDGDVFILSGSEDLVPLREDAGVMSYRPRTEGLYARIERHREAANDFWKVSTKDGLVSYYGTGRPQGADDDWLDPATIADPLKKDHVFAWCLTRTVDPFGNAIEYEYERDRRVSPRCWDQVYLKRIKYVDYRDVNGDLKYLVSVALEYDDNSRFDSFSHYRAGFEIRTRKRCKRIKISTHAGAEQVVRTYDFTYLDEGHRPPNGVSLLSKISVVGHDGDRSEDLPPLEFSYTVFEPEKRKFIRVVGQDMPAASLLHPDLELVDLFGNGLPDILEMNGTVRYWRNLGDGKFALPRFMNDAPPQKLADPGVQMVDADGDGRMDLMVTTESMSGYYPLRFKGLWDRRSFHPYAQAPSFDLKDPEVKLFDLDGDGITDALRSGARFECFFNEGGTGWSANSVRYVERQALADVNFSDSRVKLADMTGDGLQDIVLVHDGSIEYWPNLGYGNWGGRVSMHTSPHLPYDYDPKRVLLGDVDGDGLADVVYIENNKVTLWVNQSGNRWSDPIEIRGTPPFTDQVSVRLADMLGTGTQGILWSMDADGSSRANMYFLDLTGRVKPYLLDGIDNNTGAITRVEYAPSTQFFLEDEKKPGTKWKTPLPFPVHVVARIESVDVFSRSKLTAEYRYHHGYWDGAEREFRGFGLVEQLDTEIFAEYNEPNAGGIDFTKVDPAHFSPPTLVKTWFHQGPIGDEFGEWEEADHSDEFWQGDPQAFHRQKTVADFLKSLPRRARRDALRCLRGSILRTELYALDQTALKDKPFTVTEYLYGIREEAKPGEGEDRLRIFFPYISAERTTRWERGDDPLTRFVFTDDYDAYGQPCSQINIAVQRGRDFRVSMAAGESYLATHTVTTFAKPDAGGKFIVDRAASVTMFEIVNDGTSDVFRLWDAIWKGIATGPVMQCSVVGQLLHFYDGDAFKGLPLGRIGEHGALVHTEKLMLTDDILHEAYRSGDTIATPAECPPYLAHGGSIPWTAEYPKEFRDALPSLAGYVFKPDVRGSGYVMGYFAVIEQRSYDFQDSAVTEGQGLIMVKRDPLGHETVIDYDTYHILPVRVADPVGLTTLVTYDYRGFQPVEIIDQNSNKTIYTFTPMGLLKSIQVKGKGGEGDDKGPSISYDYDLLAFVREKQPVSVRTARRVHHDTEIDIPVPERDENIVTVEYTDGFGRLLQTRTQAENAIFGDPHFGDSSLPEDQSSNGDAIGKNCDDKGPQHVTVSGWQAYNNKGHVVEKYEPFFSDGWEYAPPTREQYGMKVIMNYDPLGNMIRTINPDGSEMRVIYGVPMDVYDPEDFIPTPWEAYTYDANDNAGRTYPASTTTYQHHWNTPKNIVIDALGRVVKAVERTRDRLSDGSWSRVMTEYNTVSSYDIGGNPLSVKDALGRLAFRYCYDLSDHKLRIESIDAGVRRMIVDASGGLIEQRDGKGALILNAYDPLNRPAVSWTRDNAGGAVRMGQRIEYGDGSDNNQPAGEREQNGLANRLGKPYKHYDEAGLTVYESYDFKGNILIKSRQVISDGIILKTIESAQSNNWLVEAYRVDWQNATDEVLDTRVYMTTLEYDALNRVKILRYPEDVDGECKALHFHYNRAGALESLTLNDMPYVERIAYNARGQRILVAYGNGVMTRYAYDAKSTWLKRMRTESYVKPDELIYRPPASNSAVFQELAYEYDSLGNRLMIRDRTPGCGTQLLPDRLDRTFIYSPLDRLVEATGRQCGDLPSEMPGCPWNGLPACEDLTKATGYREKYEYDPAGNLARLTHTGGSTGFTRLFTFMAGNNRLDKMIIGPDGPSPVTSPYLYDGSGNMIKENAFRHFDWDHSDRMLAYRYQADGAEPTAYVYCLYDPGGNRIKKISRNKGKQVLATSTVYVDGIFEHCRSLDPAGAAAEEDNTLHIMDNQALIAQVRVGKFQDDTTPAVKYHIGDHLGSSSVVIDERGALVSREEYTPYGETSYGSFERKRYRFNGKERDGESGLYYYGVRYYAPWLARWNAADPLGPVDGLNLYAYGRSNPARFIDRLGTDSSEENAKKMLAKHPESIHATGGEWLGVLTPTDSRYIILNPGKEHDKVMESKETIEAAYYTAMASLLIFGGSLALEMGAGGLLSGAADKASTAYMNFGIKTFIKWPRLSAFILALAGLSAGGSSPSSKTAAAAGKTLTWTKKLPTGQGETDLYGDMTVSSIGSGTNRAQALLHEKVHSYLSPGRLSLLADIKADMKGYFYKNSYLLRYVEEAACEIKAQVGTRMLTGLNLKEALMAGLRLPFNGNYDMDGKQLALETFGWIALYVSLWAGTYLATDYAISGDKK